MSRWSDILLDYNKMKEYAHIKAQIMTRQIAQYNSCAEKDIKDAVIARFNLDKLLLNQCQLEDKWCQCMVHDFFTESIIFRGNREECEKYINENNRELELYWASPDDWCFNWSEYFRKLENRCNIRIV